MDFTWNIDDLHTRQLLNFVTVAGEFDNKVQRGIHEKTGLNINSDLPHTQNIFLWAKNYPSIESKKAAVENIRKEASSPILIYTDFEWWYVHNFDVITPEEAARFGIPEEILARRAEEAKASGWWLSALPSAEFMWKKYKEIFYSKDHKARLDFIRVMQQYGKSIRNIMEYIGVDVVFGPDVDIVDDFDGTWPKQNIAENDRSFGENFIIAQDIISAFIDGFQSRITNIVLVPKHFAGVGKSENPHIQTDTSDMNRNDGSVAIFKNIINGDNPFLDDEYLNKCIAVSKTNKSKSSAEYKKILIINRNFLDYLHRQKIDLYDGDHVEAVMTSHISGDKRVLWSETPITFSPHILKTLKEKIWQKHPLENGLIFSDDLRMEWASDAIKSLWIENTEANKALLALGSGHDVVIYLENDGYNCIQDIDNVLDEVAKLVDQWVDLNHDGKADLTEEQLRAKAKKMMDLMVKRWKLLSTSDWHYQIKDGTYFDPSVKKVLMDSWLSNQWAVTWSSIEDYQKEWNSISQIIQKKWKNLRECIAHNFPNALYKYLTAHEKYASALESWKKLIIVDKSESTMFIYSLDGKKLLEQHKIWIGKWTDNLDYKHDRKVFGDDKTPVGNYMVVDKTMGEDLYKEFSKDDIDDKWYYGWSKWWMIKLIGPWTPFVAIHGAVEKKIWPSSSACVRVIDKWELSWKTDITEQKLVNHLAETIPVGSYVIITN